MEEPIGGQDAHATKDGSVSRRDFMRKSAVTAGTVLVHFALLSFVSTPAWADTCTCGEEQNEDACTEANPDGCDCPDEGTQGGDICACPPESVDGGDKCTLGDPGYEHGAGGDVCTCDKTDTDTGSEQADLCNCWHDNQNTDAEDVCACDSDSGGTGDYCACCSDQNTNNPGSNQGDYCQCPEDNGSSCYEGEYPDFADWCRCDEDKGTADVCSCSAQAKDEGGHIGQDHCTVSSPADRDSCSCSEETGGDMGSDVCLPGQEEKDPSADLCSGTGSDDPGERIGADTCNCALYEAGDVCNCTGDQTGEDICGCPADQGEGPDECLVQQKDTCAQPNPNPDGYSDYCQNPAGQTDSDLCTHPEPGPTTDHCHNIDAKPGRPSDVCDCIGTDQFPDHCEFLPKQFTDTCKCPPEAASDDVCQNHDEWNRDGCHPEYGPDDICQPNPPACEPDSTCGNDP
jgi:hypothetical protein